MKMRTNIFNLQTLYNTASGEIPADRKALHYYWPIIYTMKHLSYLLEKCAIEQNRPVLSDEKLAQILYAFETMANAAERQISPKKIPIPTINGFPTIQKEIEFLQNACCLPSNKMKMELA